MLGERSAQRWCYGRFALVLAFFFFLTWTRQQVKRGNNMAATSAMAMFCRVHFFTSGWVGLSFGLVGWLVG